MADSTVTIGGDISDLQQKLKQAGANIQGFGNQARSSLGSIDLGKAFAFAGGIAGLTSLIRMGTDFNQTMRDGEVAIGQVLQSFRGLNEEAARQEAARAIQLLTEIEPEAAGGLQELTQGFLASVGAASQAGLTIEQNVDLVARFANALSNSQQPMEQLNQEIRSVLTGNVTSDSFIGKLLEGKGLNNERIKLLAAEGQLYQTLVRELGALGEAGDTAGVAFSTLESAMRKTMGAITEGLFVEGVEGAKQMAAYLEQNKDLFHDIGEGIGLAAKAMVQFVGLVNEGRKGLMEMMGIPGLTAALEARNAGIRAAMESAGNQPGAQLARTAILEATRKPSAPATVSPVAEKASSNILAIQREIQQVERLREQIGERQFASLIKHLTPAMQIEAIEKRITQEKARQVAMEGMAAASRTAVSESQQMESADRLLRLQQELAEAKERQSKAAEAAAEKDRQAAQEAAALQQNALDLQKEMEALRAEAAGDTQKAEELRREMGIEQEKRRIMQETGMAEADALKLAKERQNLNERLANAGKEGDGKINARISGGVAEARQRAADRVNAARDRSSSAVTDAFGTFESEQARLKDSFAAAFGPGPQEAGASAQNPAAVQAARNGEAGRPVAPGGEMQQGLELVRAILETLKA